MGPESRVASLPTAPPTRGQSLHHSCGGRGVTRLQRIILSGPVPSLMTQGSSSVQSAPLSGLAVPSPGEGTPEHFCQKLESGAPVGLKHGLPAAVITIASDATTDLCPQDRPGGASHPFSEASLAVRPLPPENMV